MSKTNTRYFTLRSTTSFSYGFSTPTLSSIGLIFWCFGVGRAVSGLYLLSLQVLPIFSIFLQLQSQDSRFFFYRDCVHPHIHTHPRTHTQLHTHTLFSFLFFFHAITSFSYYLVKSVATSKILTDPKISSGADFENSFVIGKSAFFCFLVLGLIHFFRFLI